MPGANKATFLGFGLIPKLNTTITNNENTKTDTNVSRDLISYMTSFQKIARHGLSFTQLIIKFMSEPV